jgi:hypothetical protein
LSADVCLVSGGDRVRLPSPVNHKVFATLAGMDYRLECGPFRDLRSRYYFKLAAVAAVLHRYDWVVWMDDDAFVVDVTSTVLHDLLRHAERDGKFLVVADSPKRSPTRWTRINTGVFALRNDERSRRLLDTALAADLATVRAWWDPERHGLFTNGDQDAVYWALATTSLLPDVLLVPHTSINARPEAFTSPENVLFVCHFPGVADKVIAISEVAERLGRDMTLLPADVRAGFGVAARPPLTPARRRLRAGRQAAGTEFRRRARPLLRIRARCCG